MASSGRTTDTRPHVPGRLIAWTALVLALSASVGANVAQARPDAGPRLTAAAAPLIVIAASVMLERVPVSGARLWQKLVFFGGLYFVVGCAFVTSFQHQYELLLSYGNEWLSAFLLPLAIDVLIIMASVSLAIIAERRRVLLAEWAAAAQRAADPQKVPDMIPDTDPDTESSEEQRQRGGKPLTPEQRAVRLWRANPSRSAADIARELARREISVSARQVARWLEPVRTPAKADELVTADA